MIHGVHANPDAGACAHPSMSLKHARLTLAMVTLLRAIADCARHKMGEGELRSGCAPCAFWVQQRSNAHLCREPAQAACRCIPLGLPARADCSPLAALHSIAAFGLRSTLQQHRLACRAWIAAFPVQRSATRSQRDGGRAARVVPCMRKLQMTMAWAPNSALKPAAPARDGSSSSMGSRTCRELLQQRYAPLWHCPRCCWQAWPLQCALPMQQQQGELTTGTCVGATRTAPAPCMPHPPMAPGIAWHSLACRSDPMVASTSQSLPRCAGSCSGDTAVAAPARHLRRHPQLRTSRLHPCVSMLQPRGTSPTQPAVLWVRVFFAYTAC